MEVVNSAIGGGVLTSNLYIRQLNQSAALPHVCWKVAPDGVPGLLLTTGAEGGSRTHTTLRSTDFKSVASAISPPRRTSKDNINQKAAGRKRYA